MRILLGRSACAVWKKPRASAGIKKEAASRISADRNKATGNMEIRMNKGRNSVPKINAARSNNRGEDHNNRVRGNNKATGRHNSRETGHNKTGTGRIIIITTAGAGHSKTGVRSNRRHRRVIS